MKRIDTLVFAVILMLALSSFLMAQVAGDYRTKDSGDWSSAQIWEKYNGSTWGNTGTPPTGTETITVQSADSVYVNVPVSITGTLVNQGIIQPPDSLTITIEDGGTYQHDRDAGRVPKCIWAVGSTALYTGVTGLTTGDAPDDRGQDYYNLTFNTPDLIPNLNMDLTGNTVSGDIRVISTGIARWYLTSADPLDTAIVTLMGDVIVEDGTFSVQGTSNALTTFIVHHYGNINVTGGNFSISRGSQGQGTTTWYIHEGNFSMSDASSNNSTSLPGGARFVFDKSNGTQTLSLSNITYNSGSIPFEVGSTTTLDVGTDPIEGSGIFVLNADATLATAHAGGVAGCLQTGGEITLSDTANFAFNGTVAQVTSASMPDTLNDLTIDNTAGVTLSQETVINGVLHLVSGVFDNTVPFTLGPNATISNEGGSLLIPLSIESPVTNIPRSFIVEQNYPNPFNPSTTIRFQLPSKSQVTARLYDVRGQQIATFYEGQMTAGEHELYLDASNYSSGVYFYRIQAGDRVITKRMTLLK
jgi:hypothetical protein